MIIQNDELEHPEQSPEAAAMFEKLTSENKRRYSNTWDKQTYGEFGKYGTPDDYLADVYKNQLETLNACEICGSTTSCLHYSECCTAPVEPDNVCSFCKKSTTKIDEQLSAAYAHAYGRLRSALHQ